MADEDELIDEIEDEEEGSEGEEERLFANKYKSADELERAHMEAQQKLTQLSQELAEVKRQQGQHQTTQQPQQNTPGSLDEWNELFYDNPAAAIGQVLQAYHTAQSTIESSIDLALAKHENEPYYRNVQTKYKAILRQRQNELADPRAMEQIAEDAWLRAVGEFMVNTVKEVREDPTKRVAGLKQLGVEPPETSSPGLPTEQIGGRERAMLAELGLEGKAARAVIDQWVKGEDNE